MPPAYSPSSQNAPSQTVQHILQIAQAALFDKSGFLHVGQDDFLIRLARGGIQSGCRPEKQFHYRFTRGVEMSFIEVLMLLFTIWAVYVTVAEYRTGAKHVAAMREYKKLMEEKATRAYYRGLWSGGHGYKFDDEPAMPVIPKIDPNNIFEQYDAKVAAAEPAEPTPPTFSVN